MVRVDKRFRPLRIVSRRAVEVNGDKRVRPEITGHFRPIAKPQVHVMIPRQPHLMAGCMKDLMGPQADVQCKIFFQSAVGSNGIIPSRVVGDGLSAAVSRINYDFRHLQIPPPMNTLF
jgi:hypothetical protein